MASLIEKANVAEDDTFIRRVRQAMTKAAADVAAESDQTANHANRAALSKAVLTYPNEWATVFAIGVANNPNVGSGSSDPSVDSPDGDSAMEYIMGQVWDAFAG